MIGGRGVFPYMVSIGMYGPKGYGSLIVLVLNRVSILAIFFSEIGYGLHSGLELSIFFSYFFIIIVKKINKSPS